MTPVTVLLPWLPGLRGCRAQCPAVITGYFARYYRCVIPTLIVEGGVQRDAIATTLYAVVQRASRYRDGLSRAARYDGTIAPSPAQPAGQPARGHKSMCRAMLRVARRALPREVGRGIYC